MDRLRLDLKITDYLILTKIGSKCKTQKDLLNALSHEMKVTLKTTGVLYF